MHLNRGGVRIKFPHIAQLIMDYKKSSDPYYPGAAINGSNVANIVNLTTRLFNSVLWAVVS